MPVHTYRKREVAEDVLTLARQRVEHAYDLFDHLAVSFSGGKDSTACLNVTLEVAARRGRLPLDVIFYDEEAIAPETEDYMHRVSRRPGVALRWLCLPVRHVNACSPTSPVWRPWDPACPELWCRPMPPEAITALPGFDGRRIPDMAPLVFPEGRTVGQVIGTRAQESLNRYRSVANRRADNYLARDPAARWVTLVRAIYDWTDADVWAAPGRLGWDYNRAYDVLDKAGVRLHDQRCAPPFGEQPMRGLWQWAVCWPDLWARMARRVPGAATAARHARGELYGFGAPALRHGGEPWEDAIARALAAHDPGTAAKTASWIRQLLQRHRRLGGGRRVPEEVPDARTSICWKLLYAVAVRGDVKRRAYNKLQPSTLVRARRAPRAPSPALRSG